MRELRVAQHLLRPFQLAAGHAGGGEHGIPVFGAVGQEVLGEATPQFRPVLPRRLLAGEERVGQQVFPAHRLGQALKQAVGVGVHQQRAVRGGEGAGGAGLGQGIGADAPLHPAGGQIVVVVEAHQRDAAFQHGDVDERALAAAMPTQQRRVDGRASDHRRAGVRHREANPRRLLWSAGGQHHAGFALNQVVVGRPVARRPALPVAGDGAVDEVRLHRAQGLVADAQSIGRARAHVVQRDVGAGNEGMHRLQPGRALQIDGQRALVGVLPQERRRQALGMAAAHLLAAAGSFHLHHVRAHQRQLVGAQGPGVNVGEVHHANAVQKIHGRLGGVRHGSSSSAAARGRLSTLDHAHVASRAARR